MSAVMPDQFSKIPQQVTGQIYFYWNHNIIDVASFIKQTSTSPANIRLSQGSIKLIGLTEDTDYDVYCFAQDSVEQFGHPPFWVWKNKRKTSMTETQSDDDHHDNCSDVDDNDDGFLSKKTSCLCRFNASKRPGVG